MQKPGVKRGIDPGRVSLLRDMWEFAEPRKKKDLFDIFIHRVIWTPEEDKAGPLYEARIGCIGKIQGD